MRRIAMVVVFVVGCGGVQFQPVTVPANSGSFSKAQRALADAGYSIEDKDESAGVLTTKWEEVETMGLKRRFRWHITIADQVTIDSQCQDLIHHPIDPDEWTPCTQQPAERSEQSKRIAAAIGN